MVSGSHRLTASGLDDSGNVYAAAPVNIGVGQLLVHSNAVWKYLADGSDQSSASSRLWMLSNPPLLKTTTMSGSCTSGRIRSMIWSTPGS